MASNLWTRREFLRRLGCVASACTATGLARSVLAEQRPTSRPNVLFIISDDLCTALGGYRHPQCKTPNLDRLAARGVLFEKAYCQYPVCGPSRASIMCGQYPKALGTMSNGQGSAFRKRYPDLVTMPQLFRRHGYHAARVSKIYHMGIPGDILKGTPGVDDPASWDQTVNIKGPEQYAPGKKEDLSPKVQHQGVDFVRVEAEGDDLVHADGMAARHAIRLLGELRGKPFFLAVGMVRPHVPLAAPKAYFTPYPADAMKLAEVPAGDLADVPKAAQTQTNAVKYGMDAPQQRKTLSAYYACVSYMDAQVGKVLDELERLKLTEKTVIVFTSDHGYNLGQHTCWQKLSLWEDAVRSPLIISAPGARASAARGGRCAKVVELIDLHPTLADLCGLQPPAGLPGTSLRPLVEDPSGKAWKDKVAYTVTRGGGESLRAGRWRYSVWQDGKAGVELYDHDRDPGEFTNLATDPRHRQTVEELERQLVEARGRAEHLAQAAPKQPARGGPARR